MATTTRSITATIAEFVSSARPPAEARARAAQALCDTVGVILAGVGEPAPTTVRATIDRGANGPSRILGTPDRTSAPDAALANGVAAHALDYDDMCFVSLAHPSCALVPAALAAAELADALGSRRARRLRRRIRARMPARRVMNPRHYHERGWHCTSTIGTIGARRPPRRVLRLDAGGDGARARHRSVAACGLKENIGSMVKPLHAGAGCAQRRDGGAARAAGIHRERARHRRRAGISRGDGQRAPVRSLQASSPISARGGRSSRPASRVKLYPSCAATHPPLDVLLDLVRAHSFTGRRRRRDRGRRRFDDAATADPRPALDTASRRSSACRSARPPQSSSAIPPSTPSPSSTSTTRACSDCPARDAARESRVRRAGAALAGARDGPPKGRPAR